MTYANVMSTIAVFGVLGGGAYAASELDKNEVKSKHIKARAVKNADLADNAVTAPKVANGSLRAEDFAAGQIPAGPQGPRGPAGPADGPAAGVLGGTYPNPSFSSDVNKLIPVAVFSVSGGGTAPTVLGEAHRAPMTGAPTATRGGGTGTLIIDLPGISYSVFKHLGICTPIVSADTLEIATDDSGGGDLRVITTDSAGANGVNSIIHCAVYRLL